MSPGTRRDDCTIFITTSAPEGAEVRSMVAAWTAAGIAESSLWVTPDDFDTSQAGPPRVKAVELIGEEQREVDLFTALGTRSLKTIRVVLAQLVTTDGVVAGAVPQAGVMLARAITDAIPRREDDERRGTATRLRKLNVIVPVSGASKASTSLMLPGWDANVVVSPEDRPDLNRTNVYVRHPGNFVGHAGAALCAVGGLLNGMTEGTLDYLELDSTVHDNDLLVARFSVRSVVGEDIVNDLAEMTLDLESFGDAGPAVMTPRVRVAADPVGIAQRAAEHVLASDLWQTTPHYGGGQRAPQTRGFIAALRHAWSFNMRMFGVMVRWLLQSWRLKVEQTATQVIVGQEAGIDVRIKAAPADAIADAAEMHLQMLAQERQRVQKTPSEAMVHLNPAAWTLLRETATALVDGAQIPGGFPEPRVSGHRELLPPSAVVPAENEQWVGLDDRTVGALDVRGAVVYRQYLEEQLASAKQKQSELAASETELEEQLGDDRKARDKFVAEADEETVGDEGDEDATKVKNKRVRQRDRDIARLEKSIARDEEKLRKVKADLQEQEQRIESLEQEQESFDDWIRDQSSYVRSLIASVVERRERLDSETSEQPKDPEAPPRKKLSRRQFVARAFWTTVAILGLVIGIFFIVDGLKNGELWLDILIKVGYTVGATFLLLMLIHHFFYRAVREYEWAMSKKIAASQASLERTIWLNAEKKRLESQETAMADWAQILSIAVHRPWANVGQEVGKMPDSVIGQLPAAMSVAGVDYEHGLPYQSLAAAARAVYVNGWLGNALEETLQQFDEVEIESESGFNSVDGDTSDRESGPRRRFLRHLADESSRNAATTNALRRFTVAVESQEIPIPTRTVSRRGPYANVVNIPEPDYFAAIASESIAFASDVFSPAGRQRLAHYVSRSASWLPGVVAARPSSQQARVTRAEGSNAVRMDLSRRLDLRDLYLFSEGELPDNGHGAAPTPQSPEAGTEWH